MEQAGKAGPDREWPVGPRFEEAKSRAAARLASYGGSRIFGASGEEVVAPQSEAASESRRLLVGRLARAATFEEAEAALSSGASELQKLAEGPGLVRAAFIAREVSICRRVLEEMAWDLRSVPAQAAGPALAPRKAEQAWGRRAARLVGLAALIDGGRALPRAAGMEGAMGDKDAAVAARAEFCGKYGFYALSIAGPSPDSALAARGLLKVGRAIERACSKLGIEPRHFGMGSVFQLMGSGEVDAFGRAGGVLAFPVGGLVSLSLPEHVAESTVMHEWTHMLDAVLCESAKAAALAKGGAAAELAEKCADHAFFSHLPPPVKAELPRAKRGFELAFAAGLGLAGESRVSELAQARQEVISEMALAMAQSALSTGPGGAMDLGSPGFAERQESVRRGCVGWIWSQTRALSGIPRQAEADGDHKSALEAAVAAFAQAGAPRSADELERAGRSALAARRPDALWVASTMDGSRMAVAPIMAGPEGSLFSRGAAASDGAVGLGPRPDSAPRPYWSAPSEMLARLVGEEDSLQKKLGSAREMPATGMGLGMRRQLAKGFALMCADAGFQGAALKMDARSLIAGAVFSAVDGVNAALDPRRAAERDEMSRLEGVKAKLARRREADRLKEPRGEPAGSKLAGRA